MVTKEELTRKNKSLKQAIERYETYKRFVETYKTSKSLDEYAMHVKMITANASDTVIAHYDDIINMYKHGNSEPLLTSLYDKLLAADEYKAKVADEIKTLLREH